jgi:hypothetical protein
MTMPDGSGVKDGSMARTRVAVSSRHSKHLDNIAILL